MPLTGPRGALSSLAVVALVAAFVFGTTAPAQAATVSESQGRTTIVAGTNKHRTANDRSLLKTSAALDKVAQAWAASLAKSRNLAHNPKVFTQIPGGWTSAGENVAYNCGYSAPASKLVSQWKASAGHNANMLSSKYTHLGVGYATDKYGCAWGVQVFAGYPSSKTLSSSATLQTYFSTSKPAISGTRKVGSKLTASVTAWQPSATFTYQWRRDGKAISGATGKTYLLRAADKGHQIDVKVTGKRANYVTKARFSAKTATIG